MSDTGLIIGKFHPLHKGHQYLIETALGDVGKLVVVVFTNRKFSIPGEVRKGWIEQLYPRVETILLEDSGFDYSSPLAWKEHEDMLLSNVKDRISHVFSSEDYGQKVAAIFNAEHVMVDRPRYKYNIAGSDIMKEPGKYEAYLEKNIYDYLIKNF